jgi:hypothetical protein
MNALDELVAELLAVALRADALFVGHELPLRSETYCLIDQNNLIELFSWERGEKIGLRLFDNDSAACDHARNTLTADPSAWKRSMMDCSRGFSLSNLIGS